MLTLSFARATDKNALAAYISKTRNVPSISCHVHFLIYSYALPLSLLLPLSYKFLSLSHSISFYLSLALALRLDEKNEWAEWNGRGRREEAEAKVAQGREWKHRSRKLISKLLRQERIGLLYHGRNIHRGGSSYSQRYPGYGARCF